MRAALALLIAALVVVQASTCAAGFHSGLRLRDSSAPSPLVLSADQVWIQPTEPATVHRDTIVGIKSNNLHDSVLKHALIGAGVGLVFGAIVGYACGDDTPDEFLELNRRDSTALGMAMFTPLGALIGMSVHTGKDWVETPEGGVLRESNH
jgi:hypothetical protein